MCWNWIELCVLIVTKNNVVCLFQKWISELESSYRFKRRWAEGYGSQLEELEMFPRMWRFRQSRMLKLRRAGVKSGFTASKRNQWPACPWGSSWASSYCSKSSPILMNTLHCCIILQFLGSLSASWADWWRISCRTGLSAGGCCLNPSCRGTGATRRSMSV